MPSFARRRDAMQSHRDGIARALGIQVHDTSQMAAYEPGFPDALWAFGNRVLLVEHKNSEREQLTEAERHWHQTFAGEVWVCRSDEDALAIARELMAL